MRAGGPFGRHNQMRLSPAMPNRAFRTAGETLLDEISTREKFWDHCYPWTEGLAMLFDAARQEVLSQFAALGEGGATGGVSPPQALGLRADCV